MTLLDVMAPGLHPMAADRAVARAHDAGNPLVLAQARHMLSTAARRIGDVDQAERVGVRAVEDLPLTGTSPELWRQASELWCVSGYAAAVRGDRDRCADCYAEARAAAARIAVPHRQRAVEDYARAHQISAAFKLGDSATALATARQVQVEALPSAERRGRFLVDLALAWQQHGRDDHALRALAVAEQHAPGEVQTRTAARRLISTLGASPRPATPDLIGLARRAHVAL